MSNGVSFPWTHMPRTAASRFKSASNARTNHELVWGGRRRTFGRHSRDTFRRHRGHGWNPDFPIGGGGARFAFGRDDSSRGSEAKRAYRVAGPCRRLRVWRDLGFGADRGDEWTAVQRGDLERRAVDRIERDPIRADIENAVWARDRCGRLPR